MVQSASLEPRRSKGRHVLNTEGVVFIVRECSREISSHIARMFRDSDYDDYTTREGEFQRLCQ
jgi:hypothetical protein